MKKRLVFANMILRSLTRRRSRMLAALMAIAIGSTVLSGMLTIYLDIPRQLGREFRSYGANLVLVPAGESGIMSMDDVEEAAEYLPPDKLVGVTPYRYESLGINRQPCTTAGVRFAQVAKTSPYWRVDGSWPERSNEIMIGSDIARFTGITPGTQARISGHTRDMKPFAVDMTVSGVVGTGGAEESVVFVELSTLEAMMGAGGQVNLVEISVEGSQRELEEMAGEIGANVPGVAPRLVKRIAGSEATVLGKLRSLVFLVTAVVMGLILICVATTMMTVVMERRREIGLKKAIGAESSAIIGEFIAEGAALGLAGGLAGAVSGFFFAQLISVNVFNRSVAFDYIAVPAALAAAVLVTVLACLPPVKKAADIEPAVVLRGE
ncbi:MAG: ABC transporter permease [Planctomycetota bacterium]|jgi:putative ABC transport system permease protein|nr:ABC transporter permease [Planctomycetota bacterium]